MRNQKNICVSDILAAERIVRHKINLRDDNSEVGYFRKLYEKVKSLSKN